MPYRDLEGRKDLEMFISFICRVRCQKTPIMPIKMYSQITKEAPVVKTGQILAIPMVKCMKGNEILSQSPHCQPMNFFVINWPKGTGKIQDKTNKNYGWRDRIDSWLMKGGEIWERWGKTKKSSLKYKTYQMGNKIMDKIEANEWFLKHVGYPVENLKLIYPPSLLSEAQIRQYIKQDLLEHRLPYHKKYRKLSIFMIPLSALMGILPGPNVFLAYNLFRVYSHDKAVRGAEILENKLSNVSETDQVKFIGDEVLDKLMRDYFETKKTQTITDGTESYINRTLLSIHPEDDANLRERIRELYDLSDVSMHDMYRACVQIDDYIKKNRVQ